YRATRVSPSIPARIAAASTYLEKHPDGQWHEEVASWFAIAEAAFYERCRTSEEGLARYLAALPHGPHAEEAETLRRALRMQSQEAATERLAAREETMERRLAQAAESREALLTAYAEWVARLLDFEDWGKQVADLDPEFSKPWLGDAGPGRC